MSSNDHVLMQTRIPSALRLYLKAYAKQHQMNLEATCQIIFSLFLQQAPWQRGLHWRGPLSHRSDNGESQGWAQFNLFLSAELAAQLEALAQQMSISRASIVYTGLFWFAKHISPPVTPT